MIRGLYDSGVRFLATVRTSSKGGSVSLILIVLILTCDKSVRFRKLLHNNKESSRKINSRIGI
jgi:hypothetical protein